MRAVIGLVAAVLLLAGCAPTLAPTGLTEAELEEYRQTMADLRWPAYEGLGYERPEVEFIRFVQPDEWLEVTVECLEGYDVEVTVAGDESFSWNEGDGEGRLATYKCAVAYPYEPQYAGFYSRAQVDYLWDYYKGFLIPCLELQGYDVDPVPDRGLFGDAGASWNPYSAIDRPATEEAAERLYGLCPVTPFDGSVRLVP